MATTAELITQLYVGYYNRAPDPDGLNYWIGVYNSGKSLTDIANYFAVQDESKATYPYLANPNVADPNAFVNQIYMNMFGRAATQADKDYWVGQLNAGKVTPGAFIATIQYSANAAGTGDDFTTLKNKTTVGLDYATDLANAGVKFTQDSAHDVISGVDKTDASVVAGEAKTDAFIAGGGGTATSFILTTGADGLTGGAGNDSFSGVVDGTTATASTLSVTDKLVGGLGKDTLSIAYANGVSGDALNGADVSGIEILKLRNVSGSSLTLNATGAIGANEFYSDRSTSYVQFDALANGATTGLIGNGVLDFGASGIQSNYAATATTATVSLQGGVVNGGHVDVEGAALTSVTLNSTSGANVIDELQLDGTVNAVTINATSDVTISQINDVAASTKITVTGGGKVSLGTLVNNVAEVDASANTGGVTVALAEAGDKFTGGAGNDTVTLGGAGPTATVDGGAGTADIVIINADTQVDTAAEQGKVVNFEIARLMGANFTYDASKIAGINGIEVGSTGNVVINALGTQTVKVIADGTASLTLNNPSFLAAGSDAQTVTLDNSIMKSASGVDLGALTVTNADQLTINSVGKNLGAGQSNMIGSLATGNGDLEKVVITGDTAFVLNTGVSNVDSVDGSAFTAALTVSAAGNAAAINIKGGAEANMLTGSSNNDVIAGGAKADTITGGQGTDLLTGAGGADIFAFKNFTVSAGTGTLNNASTQGGVDRETITITADAVDSDNETVTIVYTLNGTSHVISGDIDTLAAADIDVTDANAVASALATIIAAEAGIGASAVNNVITVAGDAATIGQSLAINSVSFGGGFSTLAGAIANGTDTVQINTITVDVDPVVGETYSFQVTPRGGTATTITATAATTNPQDLVNALIADVNGKMGGLVVAADVGGGNTTQFTLTDVVGDNGGFGVSSTSVTQVSYTGDTSVSVVGPVVSGFDKITDFNTGGSDTLRFVAADNVAGVAVVAPVAGVSVLIDANGKATFAAADDTLAEMVATLAADDTNLANNEVVFFEVGGNTYVYGAGVDTTNSAADFLVELTGVVGLTKLAESATTAGDFTLS